jgi:NitT/TauT family transport system permease protein
MSVQTLQTLQTPRPADVPRMLPLTGVGFLELLWDRAKVPLLTVAGIVGVIIFWEWQQTKVLSIPALFIPPPSAIMKAMIENTQNGVIPEQMAWSFRNYALGFGIAATLAIPLGLLMGSVSLVDKTLGPYMYVLWSTPRIAFYPIIIVAMGFDWPSKVFLITLGCFFPILINTLTGVKTVDVDLLRVARAFGASQLQTYRKIVLPYSLAFILTGVRISVTRGLVVMYVSEIFGSPKGIGALVVNATARYKTPLAFSGLMLLLGSSLVIVFLFQLLERALTPWREAVDVR